METASTVLRAYEMNVTLRNMHCLAVLVHYFIPRAYLENLTPMRSDNGRYHFEQTTMNDVHSTNGLTMAMDGCIGAGAKAEQENRKIDRWIMQNWQPTLFFSYAGGSQ